MVSAVSMAWTRVESQYRPPSASSRAPFLAAYGNTGVDLIMECLADLGLTRCNFWRGGRERESEREEEWREGCHYVSGMCERRRQPRWKTLDEARNLFVERPQLRRGKMRTSQRREATGEFSIGGGRKKLEAFPFSFLIFEIGVLDIYFMGGNKRFDSNPFPCLYHVISRTVRTSTFCERYCLPSRILF